MVFDLVLRGGEVIDGTGRPRFRADVGITGDRITALGDLTAAEARETRDVTARIVAPGFIDVHNHTDGWLLKQPDLDVKIRQGFTTELLMSDGIGYAPIDPITGPQWAYYLKCLNALRLDECHGWRTMAEYQARLDRRCLQNHLVQIPYANVRTLAAGFGRCVIDDLQRKLIHAEIRDALDAGATGISTGLDYISQWSATTEELADACKLMAARQGVYVSHIRYKHGLMPAVREVVEIGRRAGVPVHISHLKGGNEREIDELLNYIDTTARKEVDFTFEVYPYQPGSTMLNFILPYEVWDDGPTAAAGKLLRPEVQERFRRALLNYKLPIDRIHIAWLPSAENKRWQGKMLSEYVAAADRPMEQALAELLIEERLAVLLVFNEGDDLLTSRMLQHDLGMVGSDGIYFPDGVVHPRVTGTAPRILGRAVRDWKLFSLETAVHKLAGFAAKRFKVVDRGELAAGKFADVVVFDPHTVIDRGTYAEPHQAPIGIDLVVVNGAIAWSPAGVPKFSAGSYPGRALKFGA
jgi:N-acyl-D-amino-acid deacylase